MREAAGYGPRAPRRFAYIRAWRLRRKILVAMTIVLTVTVLPAAVLAARWHAQYQPLRASSNGAGTTTRLAPGARFGSPLDPIYFQYRNGGHVIVDAALYNSGRVTVTVTGFVVPTSPYGPIVPSQLRITRDLSNFAEWKKATPVRRITVHPGERIQLFVVMDMVPWKLLVDGYVSQALPTLTVEVMGVHHLLPIDGQDIGVVGPS
jgi:hypothetical protein